MYEHVFSAQQRAVPPAEAETALRHAAGLLPAAHRRAELHLHQIGGVPPVTRAAVVGAGLLGTQIAAAHVGAALPTWVFDCCPAARATLRQRVAGFLGPPYHTWPQAAIAELVVPVSDPSQLAHCDLVLESVPESAPLKQRVFAQLEPIVAPGALLATNTSTIGVAELAAVLEHPDRFCGIHFLHPVWERVLVEVVPGPRTDPASVARAIAYVQSLGKVPLLVRDGPGFLVNRLLWPYLSEAMAMLGQGVAPAALEQAATEFGMAMGPLRIADEIGLDTLINAGRVLWRAFPDRAVASPLPVVMVKQGRLGRKSAAGFYRYDCEHPWQHDAQLDPAAEQIAAHWARRPVRLPAEQIVLRLLLAMVAEAARLLEESDHYTPHDIDLAVVFGLGFPAWRGGLLYWADRLGIATIVQLLQSWTDTAPWAKPAMLLRALATANATFYDYDWSQRRSEAA